MYLGLHVGSYGKETNFCININMSKKFELCAQKCQKIRFLDLAAQQQGGAIEHFITKPLVDSFAIVKSAVLYN